ncbi:MFS transporter [Aestuariimicrobium soli]|uniref:MFS transporter n=1 Tax=Aestuariimicrobium soli TaxID=2035834 RepID=UPI003EBE0E41
MATSTGTAMPSSPITTQPTPPPLHCNSGFVHLFASQTLAITGSAISSVLLSLVAISTLHASGLWVGLITAATWVPWVVIGLPAGAWIDRLPPLRVMIVADLASFAALVSLPIAWATGTLSLVQLLLVQVTVGTAAVFFQPARTALIPQLVERGHLPKANSWLSGSESVGVTAGLPIGGQLAAVMAPALGVVVDAVGYLASAILLSRIRLTGREATARGEHPPLWQGIKEGLRFTFGDPLLRWFTALGSLANFGLTGFQTLLVLFFVREVGLSSTAIGWAMACNTVGNIGGALLAPAIGRRWGTGRSLLGLSVVIAAAVMMVPWADTPLTLTLMLVGLATTGFAIVAMNVIRQAWRQGYVPTRLMARSTTASQFVNFGLMPVASVVAGVLSGPWGIRTTMLAMCAVVAVANLAIFAGPVRRHRDLPERVAA